MHCRPPINSARVQANAVSDRVLDLRMCDFTGKDLSGKTLSGALLKDAVLPNANLREAVLSKVSPTQLTAHPRQSKVATCCQ